MPFFPVDDDAAFHEKLREAGNAAVGLWVRAGSYSMKAATEGVLKPHELEGLGKPSEARRLVAVRLWHAAGHDCDRCVQPPKGGWVFHDWHDWGPLKSRDAIKGRREADRERQQRKRSRDRHAVTPPMGHAESHGGGPRSPGPSPSVVQVVSQSGSAARALDRLTDDDLEQIRKAIDGSGVSDARRVAATVLGKTTQPVAAPGRYVLAAVRENPGAYRCVRRTSRREDECQVPGHDGQPASNCGACAVEQRVGDR